MIKVFRIKTADNLDLLIVAANGQRYGHDSFGCLEENRAGEDSSVGKALSAHKHIVAGVDH